MNTGRFPKPGNQAGICCVADLPCVGNGILSIFAADGDFLLCLGQGLCFRQSLITDLISSRTVPNVLSVPDRVHQIEEHFWQLAQSVS